MVAILVIISILISLTVINNHAFVSHKNSINDLIPGLKIEKRHTLDYMTNNDLSPNDTKTIFTNFSNSYLNKLGNNKDSFFIFGNLTNLKIIGYKTSETDSSYFNGTEFITMGQNIDFDIPTINPFTIKIDNKNYTFNIYSGQNLYYLIKYNYNKEVYIING